MNRLIEHVRVLDLSRLIPGAYCTQLLADLGARVLKIEQPGRGDYMRQLNPFAFGALNRNKESMTLNIKYPKGREILLELIAGRDVLLESFRPGVMERLGLGYEAASRANPRLIYCSLSGYGQDGPYRLKSGHDINYLAVAGVLDLTVDPGRLPMALPVPLADLGGSLMASHAILAALVGREASGQGCYVDAAMMEAALSLISVRMAPGLGTGRSTREDLVRGGVYDVYRTRDGRFITLGVIEEKFFENLARSIGRPELARDPRFSSDQSRSRHRREIREILEPVMAGKDIEEWLELFDREDVPAAAVNRMADVPEDPQVRHRGLVFDIEDQAGRSIKQVGYPALFPDRDQVEDRTAPDMGRDTWAVLEELGRSEEEIRALKDEGVI